MDTPSTTTRIYSTKYSTKRIIFTGVVGRFYVGNGNHSIQRVHRQVTVTYSGTNIQYIENTLQQIEQRCNTKLQRCRYVMHSKSTILQPMWLLFQSHTHQDVRLLLLLGLLVSLSKES